MTEKELTVSPEGKPRSINLWTWILPEDSFLEERSVKWLFMVGDPVHQRSWRGQLLS